MTFEELYKSELEHRERLRGAVGLPLGLLMVIGGLLGTMSQSIELRPALLSVLFWIAVTGGVVYFVRAAYFLVLSYHGHVYKAMPFALQRKEYRDQLREWHAKYGGGAGEGDVEFANYIERLYAEAADRNAYVNTVKSEYLFSANASLILCVILTAIAYLPYAVSRRLVSEPVQKVQIVEPSHIDVYQGDANAKRQTEATAPEAPSATVEGSEGGRDP